MNENFDLYQILKSKLRVCYLTGRKDEIVIRCIYCGDSVKNPNKGHMYIQNKPPYKYFCQKCTSRGYTNEKFLKMLEIYDYNTVSTINRVYRDYQKKLTIKYGSDYSFLNKKIIFPVDFSEEHDFKLDYIENRLGIELNEDDVPKYKLVVSLNRFLYVNNLLKNFNNINDEKLKRKMFLIEKYCVGFLSMDKSIIAFRSLYPDKTGFRYANFSLFPEIESKKTYCMKNNINTMDLVHDIVITEGVFDLLGVYNHVYNCDDSKLYFSNNGKSFLVTLNTIKDMGILNTNITIYSDSDVKIDFYKNMMERNLFLSFNGINIHYNKIGKDYGVTKEEIDLSQIVRL